MIDVVLELTLVDDMVDLLADSLNSTIRSNLSNDEFIVLALPKLKGLVNWFRAVLNDILKLEWTQF